MDASDERSARWNRYWDKKSRTYDREIGFFDRYLFADSRQWVCGQATGTVLEVAIGTGLNLPFYPNGTVLTGIDWSEQMLAIARQRAADLNRAVTLQQADAHHLPFEDNEFDTVICTFGLCAIPDDAQALAEMIRVLCPGGKLILADHIQSSVAPVRALQRILELLTAPLAGEHFLRRPVNDIRATRSLHIENRERFNLGLVERVAARKNAMT